MACSAASEQVTTDMSMIDAAPWLTKLAYAIIQGRLEQRQDQLAREAVNNLERLGPTFIKLGQILSIRSPTLAFSAESHPLQLISPMRETNS